MRRPFLIHDIDGVLFGDYEGEFQLRPGVKTWLRWAHENFEVVWLTTWDKPEIRTLLSVVCCNKMLNTLQAPPSIHVGDWQTCINKEEWLSKNRPLLDCVEWFWIDDDRPTDDQLHSLGLDPDRCIAVNPKGADALAEIQSWLSQLLPASSHHAQSPGTAPQPQALEEVV